MTKREILQRLKGQLIVSCQAYEDNPLYGTENMVTMAKCVLAGGAKGIDHVRANDIQNMGIAYAQLSGKRLLISLQ